MLLLRLGIVEERTGKCLSEKYFRKRTNFLRADRIVHLRCMLFWVLIPTFLSARPALAEYVTLEQTLVEAYQNNPSLEAERAKLRVTDEQVAIALSHWRPTPAGSIVRIIPRSLEPKQTDRTVVEIAAANGGRYNIKLHLKHDPHATRNFAETHVRRLEAIRRATGAVTRELDGTWVIPPDHLDRAVEYERAQARNVPVMVSKLSNLPLEQQITKDGETWLDKELVSGCSEPTRDSGFGCDVKEALKRRQQWLIEQGLAKEEQGQIVYRADMLSTLQKRELTRIAGQLSDQLGLHYVEARSGDTVEGVLYKSVELASSKFAVIQKSREFTLVPWRDVLDRHIGKEISGIMRNEGISWTIGRQKGIEV